MKILAQDFPIIVSEATTITGEINQKLINFIIRNCEDFDTVIEEFNEIEAEFGSDEAYLFLEEQFNEATPEDIYFGSHHGDPCCIGFFN